MKKTIAYITSPEYRNSKPINYNLWSIAKEVDDLVAHLYKEFGFTYTDYKINLKILLMNLYQSYLVDPTQYVNYFRTTNRYKFIDKYNANKNITATYVKGSVDKLESEGFIFHRAGKHFDDSVRGLMGYMSTIRAEPKLIELINKFNVKPHMIDIFDEDAGLIEMKSKRIKEVIINPVSGKKETIEIKPKKIDFNITRAVSDMYKVLRDYNRLLNDTYIDIDLECVSDCDKETLREWISCDKDLVTTIDLTKKRVKRVFNNNNWHHGGRFYSAWWMGCAGILRKYIYISGEPTVELDYSGIHIHLLYAIKRINYAAKKEDPYSLKDNDPLRPLNKEILLTAINADGPDSTAKAVMRDLSKADKLLYNVTGEKFLKDQLELLKLKHQPIEDSIASGKGIELQCYDSNIVERIIVFFTKRKIPILTVHDSIIIQAKYVDMLNEIMWEEYKTVLRKKLKFKIKCNRLYPLAKHIFKELPNEYKHQKIITVIRKLKPDIDDRTKAIIPNIISNLNTNDIIGIKETRSKSICYGECSYYIRKQEFLDKGTTIFYSKVDWNPDLRDGRQLMAASKTGIR